MVITRFLRNPKLLITSIKRRIDPNHDKLSHKNHEVFATLSESDIAIDCGANVGKVTEQLAQTGATVYAFEPDPSAFAVLESRFGSHPRVTCINKAVGPKSGRATLYFHQDAHDDPVKWSVGSSTLSFKSNVNTEHSTTVDVIDLPRFISECAAPVALLKIDIEGAEYELLEEIIRKGLTASIGEIYVETHETRIPELKEKHKRLKKLIRKHAITNIHLNWI